MSDFNSFIYKPVGVYALLAQHSAILSIDLDLVELYGC